MVLFFWQSPAPEQGDKLELPRQEIKPGFALGGSNFKVQTS